VTHSSRDYNEGDRRSVFYAQSWLMVDYLIVNNLMPKAAQYMKLIQEQHLSVEQSVQQAFGMPSARLERELENFFRNGTRYFYAPAPADMDGKPFESRSLAAVEAQAILADLHYHERDHYAEGLAEFKKVLEQDPNNVTANRAVGEAYLRERDWKNAAESFRRAAAQGSTDARVYYFGALLMQLNPEGSEGAERWTEMAKLLQKAISLDPNYAEAYNLLAFARTRQGDAKAAIDASTKAIQLSPREDRYRMNLAGYLMQLRQYDKAAQVVAALVNSADQVVAAQARNMQETLVRVQQAGRVSPDEAPSTSSTGSRSKAELVARDPTDHDPTDHTDSTEEPPAPPAPTVNPQPIKFLKGKLLAVSCDAAPAAVLTIIPQGKQAAIKLQVADVSRVVLIGPDKFSCDWKNQNVAVNYREGANQFSVVSLELQ
jgi:Tfp pilus assembly protein PilF